MQVLFSILHVKYILAIPGVPNSGFHDQWGNNMAVPQYPAQTSIDKLPRQQQSTGQPTKNPGNDPYQLQKTAIPPSSRNTPDHLNHEKDNTLGPKTSNQKAPSNNTKGTNLRDSHNKEFEHNIPTGLGAFEHFLNSDSNLREVYEKLLSNYGIMDVEDTEKLGLNEPDPEYMLKILEESLAIHSGFKMHVRKLLQNIDTHLRRVCDKIRVLVRSMKSSLDEINILKKNVNKTKSSMIKKEFFRELESILGNSQKNVNDFMKKVKWYHTMEAGLHDSL